MAAVNNFAKALFSLASEKKEISKIFDDLDIFCKALENNITWAYYSLVLDEKSINKKIDEIPFNTATFKSFLKLLIKDRQIYKIKEIRNAYFNLADEYLKRAYINVTTAISLNNVRKKELERNLKSIFPNKELIINYSIDKSLISGIKINHLGIQIDQTINNRLKELFFSI